MLKVLGVSNREMRMTPEVNCMCCSSGVNVLLSSTSGFETVVGRFIPGSAGH